MVEWVRPPMQNAIDLQSYFQNQMEAAAGDFSGLFRLDAGSDFLDFAGLLENYVAILALIPLLISLYAFFAGHPANARNGESSTSTTTKFLYQNNKQNSRAVQLIKEVGDYVPPSWYNKHVGALVALGNDPKLVYQRQVLFESKNELVCVDWYPRQPPPLSSGEDVRVVIAFPGLGLKSTSKFFQKFVITIGENDSRMYCAVLLTRGVGCPLKSAKGLWNPGMANDGERLIKHIHDLWQGKASIFLAGFSAGTNITKLILKSERRALAPVQGAFCVASNNADYLHSRHCLESSWGGRIYSRLITSIYKDIIFSNPQIHAEIGLDKVRRLKSVTLLSDYDAYAYSYLYAAYSTEDEYYRALSPSHEGYKCPFLLLQPQDDPLHRARSAEAKSAEELIAKNDKCIYMSTAAGNHFGFYEGHITEALTSAKTYTYPARVARVFFDSISSEPQKEEERGPTKQPKHICTKNKLKFALNIN